jgi:tetratricopeptide (TPR) repeat protein
MIRGETTESTKNQNRNQRWLSVVICLALAIITGWLYWPVHTHELIGLDDQDYLVASPHVTTGITANNIVWAFTHRHASNWHPLTWISHMLDRQLFGLDPGKHHLVNVGFHIANSLLLFLILQRMTRKRWQCAFVAALFALHPLHVESVAWIAERKDVLSTFFFMLTLAAYARYAEKAEGRRRTTDEHRWTQIRGKTSTEGNEENQGLVRKLRESGEQGKSSLSSFASVNSGFKAGGRGWYGLALLFFALGLMSKPMLVTLPFVLLLLDFWPLNRVPGFKFQVSSFRFQVSGFSSIRRLVFEKIPFFALSAVSCALTIWAQSMGVAIASVQQLSLFDRITNSVASYLGYAEKMFLPINLSVYYPFPVEPPIEEAVLALFFLFIVTAYAVAMAKRRPYLLAGWLWYLGTLVPVIGLLQVGAQAMADRYTYIPLIGLFIMLTWLATDIAAQWKYKTICLGLAAAMILPACATLTARQLAFWQNDRTLFGHGVEVDNQNYVAWAQMGSSYIKENKYDQAIIYYQRATQVKPNSSATWIGMAMSLERLDRWEESQKAFQKAETLSPENWLIHNNYAVALMKHGDFDGAEVELQKARQLDPDLIEPRLNHALLLQKRGNLTDAARENESILQVDPASWAACLRLADILFMLGKSDEAISRYRDTLRLNPHVTDARIGLGQALTEKRDFAGAMAEYSSVLQSDPKNAKALDGLGFVLAGEGRLPEAKARFLESMQLDPKNPAVHFHYAMCLSIQQQLPEIILEYRKALELDGQFLPALNNLAWLLASHSDPHIRNGKEAVELAQRACRLTNNEQPFYLGTLAAAYAEAGLFNDAVATAEKARDLAGKQGLKDLAERNGQLLELYRAGKPCHEPAEPVTK